MKDLKILVIHHSHTDIGYTERQEKLKRYHVDFINQAVEILDKINEGKLEESKGFKWQCENQWQIENFYENASEEQKVAFEKYVKSGDIGLSGNYLNMTELVNYDILSSRTKKSQDYGKKVGVKIKSGMSADVNGYAWGYADALYENGVENLYCALHSHHGMFPLGKKHIPFYWITPKGKKVLTWVGEHYHFGNELFMSPHAGTSYMLFDDIRKDLQNNKLLRTNAKKTEEEELTIAKTRLTRFINKLSEENYSYGVVPILVSGAITDNGPPSAFVAKRINDLKRELNVNIKMATLDDFFQCFKDECHNIPEYSGDFTDWWADGVSSTPHTTKVYKDAIRKYDLCKKIDPDSTLGNKALVESAAENLMLYAEHTWGYSSSISEPWDSLVAGLEKKKDAYAINGNIDISKNLDLVLAKKGEVSIYAHKEQKYRIINPHDFKYSGVAKLYVEYWEYVNGILQDSDADIYAVNQKTGEKIPCQLRTISRANEVELYVELEAKEEMDLELVFDFKNEDMVDNYASIGADGRKDIYTKECFVENECYVETKDFIIEIAREVGIVKIEDKTTNRNIIDLNAITGPFGAIYTHTNPIPNQLIARRDMGRSRVGMGTSFYYTKLKNCTIFENGKISITIKLTYELEGTNFYDVYLKIFKTHKSIETKVCFHKTSIWDPENLYIELPFVNDDNETYVDKTGCVIRPGIDQLPGACQDFFLIQNGILKKGKKSDILISIKDAPLVVFDKPEYKVVNLYNKNNIKLNKSIPYSWVMNNFWETNFKADLGGFYEFFYTITIRDTIDTSEQMKYMKAVNEGLLSFYIK